MKRLRKILACMLSVCLFISIFTGFHGRQSLDAFEMPESFDETKEYNISFWAKNDTNKVQVAIYEKAIADFEKLYPNIHVTMRRFTDYGVIYNDVITNIPTLTTPNVCISYPDHIATYLTGTNVMAPLEELINSEKYGLGGNELKFDGPSKEEVVEKFLEECRVNGSIYAIPFMRSTEALYINKTLVDALGFSIPDIPTWDWIWEVSDAATKKNADGTYAANGDSVMIPFIYKSTDNMMITMTKQLGSGYSTDDAEILLFNDTTRDILKTINEHSALESFSTFKISSYPGNFINANQCIFGIDSTAGATWMGSGAPNSDLHESVMKDFEMVVRPIPQYDTENPKMISQGPSVCVFNKDDPQEVLASWLFAQFLLTNEVQVEYAKTEGYIPVTYMAQNTDEYKDYLSRRGEDKDEHYAVKIDASKLLLDNMENTFITPVFNGSASLRDAAGALIEDVAFAPKRKYVVNDEYITELYSKVQSLYRLDQLNTASTGKKDLGPLPGTAKLLLGGIGVTWIFIAIYFFSKYNKLVHKG